jgi:hypothetical protein
MGDAIVGTDNWDVHLLGSWESLTETTIITERNMSYVCPNV